MNLSCKVSVITATYRREDELNRCLRSLTEQTFADFEIILVDDNDLPEWNRKIEAIVENFKTRYPHIPLQYIQNHPSLGSAESRNVGIRAANGTYVTFLDDDDLYFPEKIAAQYAFMVERDLDYSVTDLDLYYDDESHAERRTRYYIKQTDKNSLLKYHVMHHIACPNTMMYKREYLLKIGGFPPIDMGDDFYLMERAILNGGKFDYLNRCDVKAYVHHGNIGLSSGDGKIESQKHLLEYNKKYYQLMTKKDIRFTQMRHHAVLAFAYLRMKKRGRFIREALAAFFTAPIACLKLFFRRKSKR